MVEFVSFLPHLEQEESLQMWSLIVSDSPPAHVGHEKLTKLPTSCGSGESVTTGGDGVGVAAKIILFCPNMKKNNTKNVIESKQIPIFVFPVPKDILNLMLRK